MQDVTARAENVGDHVHTYSIYGHIIQVNIQKYNRYIHSLCLVSSREAMRETSHSVSFLYLTPIMG